MDQTVKPAHDLWLCEVDDVTKAVTVSAWQDAWTLLLTVPDIAVYPDRVTLEYAGPDENLKITWDKQWEPWGPILSPDIGRRDAFNDRGDPAVYDYDKDDLIKDGAWHDLDLSAIVPAGAKAVLVVGHVGSILYDLKISFRKKGNIYEINHSEMETLRADPDRCRMLICAVDTNRVLQYKADADTWSILDLAVRAWWF